MFTPVDNTKAKMHSTPLKINQVNKKYLRENLKSWITYKNQEPYYQYLELIEKLVRSVFKQEETINPLTDLTKGITNQLSPNNKPLFINLVHSLTLLNHTYRVFTVDGYLTTKEDILNAAALLQLDINQESMLFFRTKIIYWEMQVHFTGEEFTIKEVANRLAINKKTLSRHFIALRHVGYIKHIRTGIRNTFYYRIS